MSTMRERKRKILRYIAQDIRYTIHSGSSDLANSTDECYSGDSYSQTGFGPSSTHPPSSNAIANQNFPGYTTDNSKNWVSDMIWDNLKRQLTERRLVRLSPLTILLFPSNGTLHSGTTVDASLVAPYEITAKA